MDGFEKKDGFILKYNSMHSSFTVNSFKLEESNDAHTVEKNYCEWEKLSLSNVITMLIKTRLTGLIDLFSVNSKLV